MVSGDTTDNENDSGGEAGDFLISTAAFGAPSAFNPLTMMLLKGFRLIRLFGFEKNSITG